MKRVEIQFSLFLPRREKTITKLEVGSRERIQQLEITGGHLGRTRIKQIKKNLRLGTTIRVSARTTNGKRNEEMNVEIKIQGYFLAIAAEKGEKF
jgi:hypothetical protein